MCVWNADTTQWMPLWWKVFVGLKARNTSWAQIWQSSKNIVCGFVAGNLAKSYEQLLEYEKVFMAIRSFKKNTTSLPRTSFFRAVFFAPYWGCNVLHDTFKRRTPQWMCGYQTIDVAGFLFVQSWCHSSQRFIQDACVYLESLNPKTSRCFFQILVTHPLWSIRRESDLCRCSQGWAYLRLQLQKNWNVWGRKDGSNRN